MKALCSLIFQEKGFFKCNLAPDFDVYNGITFNSKSQSSCQIYFPFSISWLDRRSVVCASSLRVLYQFTSLAARIHCSLLAFTPVGGLVLSHHKKNH